MLTVGIGCKGVYITACFTVVNSYVRQPRRNTLKDEAVRDPRPDCHLPRRCHGKNFDFNFSSFVNFLLSVDSCGNIFVDMNYNLKIALFYFLLLHYQYQIAHFIIPDKKFMSDQ